MKEWLIYWGTWKGKILKAIIIEGAKYWNEIRDITNLPPNSLNKALSELYAEGIIQKNYDESYRVIPEIFRKYKQFFEGSEKVQNKHDEKSKIVFVIHGRNHKAHDSIFEFLRSIGLHPLEWSEAIFETGKGTPYIGEILEEAFSLAQAFVVLMTPDDEARLCEQFRESSDEPYEKQLTPQARPNVLFEAGMAMGKFPKNTILIELGKLRPFSDIGGRHTVRLDNSIEKRKDLICRLENAGCPVDQTQDDWKHAGNFDSAVGADDPKFEHLEARLFYPPDVSWEKGERTPHKNNPRHKLVLVTDLKKAYYVGKYAWNLILLDKIPWFSDDEQDLRKWCISEGYEYIPKNGTEKKLLKSFFSAEIIDKRKNYRQGENVLFRTHYRGELKNGFFDNEITGPNKFKEWSWAPDTLENALLDTQGKLDGYVNHLSKWSWGIPRDAPSGKYTIFMRVYTHHGVNKRPIINEKIEELTVVSSVRAQAKYYGERWVETRRSRMEHSNKLKDHFFKPWLEKISEYKNEYCEIDAKYSIEKGKIVPLKPTEPDNLEFFTEAMSHLKNYEKLLKDWENLKQETLKFNEELAILFEEIRVLILKEIDMPYWCPRYSGDKPDEYLCPNKFIRSIFDEVVWRIETGRKQFYGNGTISPTISGEKRFYYLKHGHYELAGSLNEELMKQTQQLFSKFIEDKQYRRRIKAFMNKKKDAYDKKLEKVKEGIRDIIKSIELVNIIKGKCRYCP